MLALLVQVPARFRLAAALLACFVVPWASTEPAHAKPAFTGQPVFWLAQSGPLPPLRPAGLPPSPSPAGSATAPPPALPPPAGSSAPASASEGESAAAPGPHPNLVPLPPLLPLPSDPVQRSRWLGERIDLLVQLLIGDRARVGVAVLDVDSGRLLYGKSDNSPFNIASNVKIFTSAAALALLGPEYRFKTVLYGDRDRERSELKAIYLRGFGDPTLNTEDLWRLTSELQARGVKKIKGDIFIDDSFFDDQRVAPAFEQKSEDHAFRAPQGAVSLNYNAIGVHVYPGAADGQPARVILDPQSPYFVVSNETRTTSSGRTALVVGSEEDKDAPPGHEHTLLRVRGTIKVGDSGLDYHKRVVHPDLYAAWTLYELLTRRGIAVLGKPSRGSAPPSAQLIDSHYSAPLGVLVRDINKRSNNFMAEQVLKSLGADSSGRPGSWQKGLQAVSRYLEGLGILPGKYQMQNGSGLYDSNRFTPAQVVTLLRAAYRDFRFSADFVASLSLAGADGTIGHRLSGGIAERFVRAKTGTLNGVSCMSGFASAPLSAAAAMRAPLAFAVLVNDHEDGAAAKRLQDTIAEALVAYQSSSTSLAGTATAPTVTSPPGGP